MSIVKVLTDPNPEMERLHDLSFNHRADIEQSKFVGCYFCLRVYDPRRKGRLRWTDNGKTAICGCWIDSVLPGSKVDLSYDLLKKMYDHWFGQTISLEQYKMAVLQPDGTKVLDLRTKTDAQ